MWLSCIAFVVCWVLFVAACGSGEPTSTTRPEATTTSTVPIMTSATTTSPTAPSPATTVAPPTSATSTTARPGEATAGLPVGSVIGVVGVSHDDELNVRVAPGAASEIIGTLGPTTTGVEATGNAWAFPNSIWYQVQVGGATGWVHAAYVGFVDGTDDVADEVVAILGEVPAAATMEQLGAIVTAALGSREPATTVTMVVAPHLGDLGEVTYDMVGLQDDSVLGYRLHIFGQPNDNGSLFSLMAVESTLLCWRGLSGELCV